MSEFREEITAAGQNFYLIVNKDDWHIHYVFPGPDYRYKFSYLDIRSRDIDLYIEAYAVNFKRYLDLSEVMPASGDYREDGARGMKIEVGGYKGGGVFVHYAQKTGIKNEQGPIQIQNAYEAAKLKAERLMDILKTVQ